MNVFSRPLFPALPVAFALLVIASTAPAQPTNATISGEVTDPSGALLPGVNVVATVNNHILASTVTDAHGAYRLEVPPGPTRITFELDGFSTSIVALIVQAGIEANISRRMNVASIEEIVDVVAPAPIAALAPAPRRAGPKIIPVPPHDRASVCGPTKPEAGAASLGTILSYPGDGRGALFFEGDELLIQGGTTNGLDVGTNVVARRRYRVNGVPGLAAGEHTSGLIQIVAAGERASRAVVVYACDEIVRGDFLAAFNPEQERAPDPIGTPAFWDAAQILFSDIAQLTGTPRRMMVIDRGRTSDLRAGQRLTLFRKNDRDDTAPPLIVGDAVIVAVRRESATIRVLAATGAIAAGDWAAPQLYPADESPVAASAAQEDLPR